MFTLYSADRCPFAARVRIALAEKGLQYELVEIDLDDRPAWMYDKNPLGKVPVLEEDGFVLAGVLIVSGLGPEVIFSRTPVRSMKDLRRLKFWHWSADEVGITVAVHGGVPSLRRLLR